MAVMKKDRDMKGTDADFQYAKNEVAVKWSDNRGVTWWVPVLKNVIRF